MQDCLGPAHGMHDVIKPDFVGGGYSSKEGDGIFPLPHGPLQRGLGLICRDCWRVMRNYLKCENMVPKAGFEPAHPGGRQTLNLVRLPFRHFGTLEAIIVF